MKAIGIVLFFLLMASISVSGQKTVFKDTIVGKLRLIRKYVNAVDARTVTQQKIQSDCILTLNDAISKVTMKGDKFPALYNQMLDDIAALSQSISSYNGDEQIKIITLLNKDIGIKFGANSNGLSSDLISDLVPVKVTTAKNGVAVNSLRVHYNPLGYKIDLSATGHTYGRLTSPVTESLVPGYYTVWVTRDGDTTLLRSINVEVYAEKDNDINFEIP